MYWLLLKLIVLTFMPLPIGAKIVRPDPTKNEWIFSCREWKSPYSVSREVYLELRPAVKTE